MRRVSGRKAPPRTYSMQCPVCRSWRVSRRKALVFAGLHTGVKAQKAPHRAAPFVFFLGYIWRGCVSTCGAGECAFACMAAGLPAPHAMSKAFASRARERRASRLGKGSRRFVPGASHCLPRGGVSKEFASRARKRALAAPRRRTQGICLLAHIVQRAPANTGRHVYEELASGARALPAVRTARRLLRPQGHDGILLCRAAGGDDARDEREQHADEHQHERDVHGEDGV